MCLDNEYAKEKLTTTNEKTRIKSLQWKKRFDLKNFFTLYNNFFFKHGDDHQQVVGNVCQNLLGQEPREDDGEEDEGGGEGADVLGGAVAEVAGAVALARCAPLATTLLLRALGVEETISGDG